jgi:hypothetical protein
MFFEIPSLETYKDLPFAIDIFPYQHISHFYPATIRQLLKCAQFDVLDIFWGPQKASKSYGMLVVAKPIEQKNSFSFTNYYSRSKSLLEAYFSHRQEKIQMLRQRIESFIDSFGRAVCCVIFGAGENGKMILSDTNIIQKTHRLYFIDNNSSLQGSRVCGIEVYSPGAIHELHSDCVILASIDYQDDMETELINRGYSPEKIIKAYDFNMFVER